MMFLLKCALKDVSCKIQYQAKKMGAGGGGGMETMDTHFAVFLFQRPALF